jgi:flagellar hook-length control protein FliK
MPSGEAAQAPSQPSPAQAALDAFAAAGANPQPAFAASLPGAVAEAGPSRAAPIVAATQTPAAPAGRATAAIAATPATPAAPMGDKPATPATAAEPAVPAQPAVPGATAAIAATPAIPAAPTGDKPATPATPALPAQPAVRDATAAAAATVAPDKILPEAAPVPAPEAANAAADIGVGITPDEQIIVAAVAAPTLAVAATTPVPGEVMQEAAEAVRSAAAAPQSAVAAQAAQTNRAGPPAQRNGAQGRPGAAPGNGSAQPGAGAQAAPAASEAPANDHASPVREAALAVASGRLAPGHAARGGEAVPESAAFRETLANVLPDNASPGPAEGARATAQPATAAARGPMAPPVPIADQVAVHIRQAVAGGDSVVRIRLQPIELGRIDVRLEIAEGGRLSAVVTAERPDTLELLMREARGLEKALEEAGLDVDSDSLAFDLRDQGESDGEDSEAAEGGATASDDVVEAELVMPAAAIAPAASVTGIDIRV